MLVTDFNLDIARRQAVANLRSYSSTLDHDDLKVVRLRVHVQGADLLPPMRHLGSSLYLKSCNPPAADAGDAALMHKGGPAASSVSAEAVEGVEMYSEVENRIIQSGEAGDFWSFLSLFEHGNETPMRVEFFIVESETLLEYELGYADISLAQILGTPEGKMDVALLSMEHHGPVGRDVSFGVDWVYEPDAVLALELFVKVDRKRGWPFVSNRVFFIVFRKEAFADEQWKPIYLSEVRVKQTDHPQANGCMMYTVAELSIQEVLSGEDCALRIEFFQYKTKTSRHEHLGHFLTSLAELRQAKSGSDLGLHLNSFTNAEIVGRSTMTKSRFTARCALFTIHTEFGGPVDGNYLFLDFSLAYTKDCFRSQQVTGSRHLFSSGRPYYQLSCGIDMHNEVIHRSVKSAKTIGSRFIKFPLAKINVERLKGTYEDNSLCFSLYSSAAVLVAWVRTTLSDLVNLPNGSLLSVTILVGGRNKVGFLVLDRRELTNNEEPNGVAYISLRCVLGQESPRALGSSSESLSDFGAAGQGVASLGLSESSREQSSSTTGSFPAGVS